VDLRKGVQGQRTLLAAELRVLRDDAPMTEAEIDKFIDHYCGIRSFARQQAGQTPRSYRAVLLEWAKDSERLSAARHHLIEAGCTEARVNRFPPLQAILLDDKRAFEIERDERMKLLALPLWQIDCLLGQCKTAKRCDGLFADQLPDIVKLRRTQGQLEQQIALLRHVEALRLYAAEQEGRLPAQLSDLGVPAPADPVTGKPFTYALEGATAHIRASAPSTKDGRTENNIHNCVTIQK
jgi:hypothetical protein